MKLGLRLKGGIHLHSISHQIKVGHPADQVQSCGIKSYFRRWNNLFNNNQEISSWFLSSWNIPGHVSDIMMSPMQEKTFTKSNSVSYQINQTPIVEICMSMISL